MRVREQPFLAVWESGPMVKFEAGERSGREGIASGAASQHGVQQWDTGINVGMERQRSEW